MTAILLIITIASVAIIYAVARKRGANTRYWIIMALIFGPFAIPFVFFSKPKLRPE